MTIALVTPMLAGLGTPELLIILAVVVLLFGAAKLPDLARNSGRALRIFKSETKGLLSDDDKTDKADRVDDGSGTGTAPRRELEARDERDRPTD